MELAASVILGDVSSRGRQPAEAVRFPLLWILYGDVAEIDMLERREEDAGTTLRPICGDLVPGDEYRIAGAKRPAHSLRC